MMSMSKKDYEVIAAIVRSTYNSLRHEDGDVLSPEGVAVVDRMVDSMASAFKRDSVRFRRDRFLEAATPDWHRKDRGLPRMKRTPSRIGAVRPKAQGF